MAAMLNFRSTPKSGRGPSNEHLWQVWLKSVQWFQRRRVKCEKLMDGRLPMTKAHMAIFFSQYYIFKKTGHLRAPIKCETK